MPLFIFISDEIKHRVAHFPMSRENLRKINFSAILLRFLSNATVLSLVSDPAPLVPKGSLGGQYSVVPEIAPVAAENQSVLVGCSQASALHFQPH